MSAEEKSSVEKDDRYVWETGHVNGMVAGRSLRNLSKDLKEWGNWRRDIWEEAIPDRVSSKSKGPEVGAWLGCCIISLCYVTNYHKLGGLKGTFSLLKFWRPEVPSHVHWAEIKVLAGLCSLLRKRRIWFLLHPASGGYRNSLALATLFQFLPPRSHCIFLSVCDLPLPLSYKDTGNCI